MNSICALFRDHLYSFTGYNTIFVISFLDTEQHLRRKRTYCAYSIFEEKGKVWVYCLYPMLYRLYTISPSDHQALSSVWNHLKLSWHLPPCTWCLPNTGPVHGIPFKQGWNFVWASYSTLLRLNLYLSNYSIFLSNYFHSWILSVDMYSLEDFIFTGKEFCAN